MSKSVKKLLILFLFLEVLLIVVFAVSSHSALATSTTDLVNPLGFVNVNNPSNLVSKVIQGFSVIIAAIAVSFTVFSGFKLVVATSEETIKTARSSLFWSISGLVVALTTFTLTSGVAKFFGFQAAPLGTNAVKNPVNIGDTAKSRDFIQVMFFVMQNFLAIVGFAAIMMIIYYGYRYIASQGNEEQIEIAKNGLKWTVLGFLVAILGYTIIVSLQKFLLTPPA